jgi:hypothetical protein
MFDHETATLRLAHDHVNEMLEAKQRSRQPRGRSGRKALAERLHRFADRLDN